MSLPVSSFDSMFQSLIAIKPYPFSDTLNAVLTLFVKFIGDSNETDNTLPS